MKRFFVMLMALIALLGGGIANASSTPVPTNTANGTANHSNIKVNQPSFLHANNTCYSGYSYGWQTSRGGTTYRLNPNNISAPPPWCIQSHNARLVIQNNGDLTLWTGLYSGGDLMWRSAVSANKNAYFISFQTDGNIVIYTYDMTPLWASNVIGADSCGDLFTEYLTTIYIPWGGAFPRWHEQVICEGENGDNTQNKNQDKVNSGFDSILGIKS